MVSTQPSLFDTAIAEVENLYKAGDWIKVRKKPAIAVWVKRGEIFQINAVSPKDGSIRFWNPYIDQWDFLYPDEIKLTVEPVVGEVAALTVESVVGEVANLTVESVVGEVASLTVESVVGEVPGLTVESVVGEVKNCNSGNAYGWIETHYKIRINGKQRSLTCPEIGCTGPYYSYRWMDGKRQRTKYCPAKKLPAVNRALQLGKPISEILEIISNQ